MGPLKKLDKLEEYLCSISLCIMVIINFANVLSRYVLHASWSFSEEILIIMFVWCMMLASATAFKRSAHLGLTVFTDNMPPFGKRACIVLALLSTAVLAITLIVTGWRMVANQLASNQLTPVLMLPEAIAGLAIPVGSLVILIRAVQTYVNDYRNVGAPAKEGEKA